MRNSYFLIDIFNPSKKEPGTKSSSVFFNGLVQQKQKLSKLAGCMINQPPFNTEFYKRGVRKTWTIARPLNKLILIPWDDNLASIAL